MIKTVQEAIDALNKIEDKTKPISILCYIIGDSTEIEGIDFEEQDDEVYIREAT